MLMDDLKSAFGFRLKLILIQRTWWIYKLISRKDDYTGYLSSCGVSAQVRILSFILQA